MPDRPSHPRIAAFWMAGAIMSFSFLAIGGRAVSVDLSTFEIMLWRSLIGLAVVLAVVVGTRSQHVITTARLPQHLARNIAHFAGQNLWFYAITVLPLATVFALEFTTPIWGLLMAPFFLGEKLTRRGIISAAIGFVGILIVARPTAATVSPGLLAAAGCAIGFALSIMFTKRLTRHEPLLAIMFWLNLMQTAFSLLIAGYDGEISYPAAERLHWMLLIGVAGLTAHVCLTRSLQSAPATIVMPMDFVRLPVIAVVAMMLYSEPLDPFVFAGGAVIVFGNWVNLRRR